MFLMFHLGRPDVLPVGDQGIRNAVEGRVPARASCRTRSGSSGSPSPWRPYRTLACLFLWSSLDNEPV